MKMNHTLLFFLFLFPIFGYSQTKNLSDIKEDYIQFGSGGGFTGKLTCHILTKNGALYLQNDAIKNSNELTYQKQIGSCSTKKIFRFATNKSLQLFAYNKPGNMYKIICLRIDIQKNTIIWSDTSDEQLINTIKLYNKLQKLIL